MDNVIYREYRPGDVPALSLLWREVFGDPLSFTANFFALLPDMGSFVVAEEDGVLLGGAGILNGRTESTLVPNGTATRAETAAMLQRFAETMKL